MNTASLFRIFFHSKGNTPVKLQSARNTSVFGSLKIDGLTFEPLARKLGRVFVLLTSAEMKNAATASITSALGLESACLSGTACSSAVTA